MGKSGYSVSVRLRHALPPKVWVVLGCFSGVRVFNTLAFAIVRMCHPRTAYVPYICFYEHQEG